MLKPSYISEAIAAGHVTSTTTTTSSHTERSKRSGGEKRMNPKLKQCYEVRTQLKPFYSGGKIVILDDETFACQHGSSVKLINRTPNIKTENNGAVDDTSEDDDFRTSFTFGNEIEVELDEIISFDACPISRIIVTAHKSNLLRLWCLTSGKLVKVIKSLHHMPIGITEIYKAKAFADSGILSSKCKSFDIKSSLETDLEAVEDARSQLSWITVSGAAVKLWQTGGNQMSKLVRIENITSLGYIRWSMESDENKFYAAERHIYIMGINPTSKQLAVLRTLEGHYSQVTGIQFNSDGVMMSGGRDKVLILWDMKNDFNKLKTIPFSNSIEGIYLAGPSDMFVAVNPSKLFQFNVKKHKLSKDPVLDLNENEIITGFYSPTHINELNLNSCLITTHTGGIYETIKSKSESKSKVTISIIHQYVGDLDEILCAALWSDGKVAVSNNTNVIKVYDLKSGSCDFLRGHTDIVLSLSCRKDRMVSSAKDNQIIFWTSTSLEPQVKLSGHLASVTSVYFSPMDVIFSVSEDHFLKVWDKKRLLRGVVAHDKEINSVHCSPNGALVATGSRDKTAKIWDSESLQLITTLKGHKKGVWDAKFSSWDQLVATASADTTIKIWSLSTFDCVQTLQGHLSSVLQLQFINSGFQVVSVSSDGSMKGWELKSSTCLFTEECGNDKIWTVDVSPEGDTIVTGSADSILTVWRDITEEKVSEAIEKKKKLVEDEQQLNNLLHSKKWTDAFQMALKLDRPFTLLKVIREVSDIQKFNPVIRKLDQEQLVQLLHYVTQWNTNTKTSTEAQILLNVILFTIPPNDLSRLIQPMQLLPYTEKHLDRLQKMQRQMVMLDFIANDG